MFFFGFEETKFTHSETLAARQGSVITVPATSEHVSSADHREKQTALAPKSADMESGFDQHNARELSVVHTDPSIPRKTYLQKLTLTTTSPGNWSDVLRHSWQPFMILGYIPGVLFCALTYAILLAYSTVMTTVYSEYMLLPPYNFDASDIGLMSLAPFVRFTSPLLVECTC